ncbi:MAG: hypothetical protein A3C47_07020 [Omnitrophica bacterium RIFCSPHIGHO2_02_FULL_51_18]|nr:MAG: hypothetical protein A3C47_07020 [Omnitrophica bacterium RIFCSPHIGHO2_02_FULL_51_18]
MDKRGQRVTLALFVFILGSAAPSLADETVEMKDKNKDGKADTWYYLRNGVIYKKEYDRNFDGRPDFGIIAEDKKFLEKQYDDNFDGKFEKTVKKPEKDATGRVQTTALIQ